MGGTEENSRLQEVVPVSVFCSRYNVSKEVSRSFGLYNQSVRPIGELEFEQLKLDLRACRVKRQREEVAFFSSKKSHSVVEPLEGDTLASSYPYKAANASMVLSDMLQSDLDVSYTLEQQTGKEILVSEDVHGEATLATQFQELSSAGSLQYPREPPGHLADDCRPWILVSEIDNVRNSSPPASSW